MSPTPMPTMCSCFSSHFGMLPLESELMVKSSGTAVSIRPGKNDDTLELAVMSA